MYISTYLPILNDWINGYTGNDYFNCIYLRDYLSYGRTLDPEHNGSNVEYGKVVKGFSHESFDANEDEYWYIDIPAGFNAFGFERKNSTDQNTGFANRTIEFEYGIPLDGVNNCFTIIDEKDGGRYTGSWGPLPNCTVELGWTNIGSYSVKDLSTNTIYTATPGFGKIFTVPYGTQLEVAESNPGDEAYTNTIGMLTSDNENVETAFTFQSGNPEVVTITRNTKFDDLYQTKPGKTVFIGIPKNDDRLAKWFPESCNQHGTYGHDIFVWQYKNTYNYQYGKTQSMVKKVGKVIEAEDTIY